MGKSEVLRKGPIGLRPPSCYERGLIGPDTYNFARERRTALSIGHVFQLRKYAMDYDIELGSGVIAVAIGALIRTHHAPAGG